MITSNISFTGISIDKTSIPQPQAQKLENAFSALSDSLGDALHVKVTCNEDQVNFNMSEGKDQKEITTIQVDKDTPTEEIQKTLSSTLIKYLSQTTTKLTERVQQLQQKDDEMGQCFNQVIHDLRNPLQTIQGFNDLLNLSTDNPEQLKNYSKKISNSTKQMNTMLEQLLTMMRIGTDKKKVNKQPVSVLYLFANGIESNILPANKKSIKLVTQVEENMPYINIDHDLFTRVIDNLLSNAIKFSHEDKNVYLIARQEDNKAIIVVQDQGQGIPEKEIPKLFTPFAKLSSTPTAGESSNGLGLASVKKIVEAHGGTIEAKSKVGEGTKFVITLPLNED